MDLSEEFQNKVLSAIKDREVKSLAIISGVEHFLDVAIASHEAESIDNMYVDTYTKTDTLIKDPTYGHLIYRSSCSDEEGYSTQVEVIINSSGMIELYFVGNEFTDRSKVQVAKALAVINQTEPEYPDSKMHTFDSDGYTAEEAVAKILTIIQCEDINDFGPLIGETINRILAESNVVEFGASIPSAPSPIRN